MIAFSSVSIFQVRLPAGSNQTNLIVSVRDLLDCSQDVPLPSINIIANTDDINNFINVILNPSSTSNNEFVQLLSSGNQNIIGQVVISLSQQFNQMNTQSLDNAVSSKFYLSLTIVCSLKIII